MPTYDYECPKCETVEEITHSIHKNPKLRCQTCQTLLKRLISRGVYLIESGIKESITAYRESEHNKQVKDPERAVKARKKAFGQDAVGDTSMQTDPRHIIKGRALAGQQKEVDKKEFIQAAAKDDYILDQCIKVTKSDKKSE